MKPVRTAVLALAVATLAAGCGLDVDTDHRTVSSAAQTLDDAGPEPGSLTQEWEITLEDEEAKGYQLIAGQVIAVLGDGLRAYDASTGEATWHYREPGRTLRTLGETDGSVVIETTSESGEDHLVGLAAGTGEQLWENSDGWSLAEGTMAGDDHGTYGLADAAAGVVVVQPEGPSTRAGIDAATGEELWTSRNSDVGPGCTEETADDTGTADADLVLLRVRCEMPDGVLIAVDAATGEFRWRRPESANGNPGGGTWTGLVQNVALNGANDSPPVLVGPDGSELFRGEDGSVCPCDLRSSGGTLVLNYSGADGSAVVAVDPGTGDVTPLPGVAGFTGHPGGMTAADGLVYTQPAPGQLLPETASIIDVTSGESHVVPMPHGAREARVTWLGAAGGSMFVARQAVEPDDAAPSGPTTLTSYALKSSAEPVELGGVAPEDWPAACSLLDGLPAPVADDPDYDENDDGEYPEIGPSQDPVQIGAVTVPPVRCSVRLGEDRWVAVQLAWVAADDEEAAARLADVRERASAADDDASGNAEETSGGAEEASGGDTEVPGGDTEVPAGDAEVPGADEVLVVDSATMLRVGSVIVTVDMDAPTSVHGTILEGVAANVLAAQTP